MPQNKPLKPNDLWGPQQPPAPTNAPTFEKFRQIFADIDKADRQEGERMHWSYQTREHLKTHPASFGACAPGSV